MDTTAEAAAPEQTDIEPIVDADVVDESDKQSSRELVTSSGAALPSARIIAGENPDEIINNATTIANSLTKLVEAQGFAVNMGGRKPHLEIAAWQAVGVLLGALGGEPLHPETVWSRPVGESTTYHVHEKKKRFGMIEGKRGVIEETERDYDAEGYDWEARVEVRTAAGVVVGVAEGMCSRAESQWMQKPDPALKSMAETRAASRAFRASLGWVVAIAGYNPTPAEEMPPEQAEQGPKYGPKVSDKQLAVTRQAIGFLFDPEEPFDPNSNAVGAILNDIEQSAGGYLPHFALASITRVAGAIQKRMREQAKLDGEEAAGKEGAPDATPADAELRAELPGDETEQERLDREYAEAAAEAEAERAEEEVEA